MMLKRALASGEDFGAYLLTPGHPGMVKTAGMLPLVEEFIATLRPDPRYMYTLVNAMGYSEFYGANSNRDYYGYNPHLDFNGLTHDPEECSVHGDYAGWQTDPVVQARVAKTWPYGYPCFYGAAVYAHHKNTDPASLGFGDVIFAGRNEAMKRIELVMRVDLPLAHQRGHSSILDRVSRGDRVDVSMGTKVPFDNCVLPETLVRTPDGWRPAGEIVVGDRVLSHRGRYRSVLHKFVREVSESVVGIRAAGVPTLQVTDEHPLLILRQGALRQCRGSSQGLQRRCSPDSAGNCSFCGGALALTPEWVPAGDVRLGDYLVGPPTAPGRTQVDPAKARLLGYWLGDGHRIRQRTGKKKDGDYRLMGFAFTVAHTDTAHRERLLQTIVEAGCRNEPNVYECGADRAAYQIHTYDQELATWLVEQGSDHTYSKRIAEDVFSWEPAALLQLLGGWIDTDGHFDAAKGLVRIATSRRELALDGQQILRTLGVPAGITSAQTVNGEVYQLSIQRDHSTRLELWRYSEKVQPQLHERAGGSKILLTSEGCALHPIRQLEQIPYTGTVINFSVEEDESYVAEGVATHNCSICTDWDAMKTAWKGYDKKRHASPGIAILAYHRTVKPIRGLAITKADYCQHMVEQPGAILPDGQKVFVYNDFPKFFDISFVWVGADRTARVMWYMGADSSPGMKQRPSSLSELMKGAADMTKTAALEVVKSAEIEKEVTGGLARKIELCSSSEVDLPFGVLAEFSKLFGARTLLSTLGGLGIPLKPQEFHHVVAVGSPLQESISKQAALSNVTFMSSLPGSSDRYAVSAEFFSEKLAHQLLDLLDARSSFAPHLHQRLGAQPKLAAAVSRQVINSTLVHGVAAEYNGYRGSLLKEASSLFPKYYSVVPVSAADMMKVASSAGLLLSKYAVVHWVSAHLEKVASADEELRRAMKYVMSDLSYNKLSGLGVEVCSRMDSKTNFLDAFKLAVTTAL